MNAKDRVIIKEVHHFEIRKSHKGKNLHIKRKDVECIRRIAAFVQTQIRENDSLPTKEQIDRLFPENKSAVIYDRLLKQAAEIGTKHISQTKSGKWKVEIVKNNAVFSKVYSRLKDALIARSRVLSAIGENHGVLPQYLITRTRKPKSRRHF